jgi:hypothetical protein
MSTNWNGPQPAPKALWLVIHANFPTTRNLGIYNPRNVAGTKTPSHHAEGRALDIGLLASNPDEKPLGDELFQLFIDSEDDLGLDEIIWNHQISSASRPAIHPYAGLDPHTNHIHVGFTRPASQKTVLPASFLLRVAILRTGLEDLRQSNNGLSSRLA